jgi:hypothetical protein
MNRIYVGNEHSALRRPLSCNFWSKILLRAWSEGPRGGPTGFLNRTDRMVMSYILMKQRFENGTDRSARASGRGPKWPKVAHFSPLRAFVHVLRRAFGRCVWRERAERAAVCAARRLVRIVKWRVNAGIRRNCNGLFILSSDHVLIDVGFGRRIFGVRTPKTIGITNRKELHRSNEGRFQDTVARWRVSYDRLPKTIRRWASKVSGISGRDRSFCEAARG